MTIDTTTGDSLMFTDVSIVYNGEHELVHHTDVAREAGVIIQLRIHCLGTPRTLEVAAAGCCSMVRGGGFFVRTAPFLDSRLRGDVLLYSYCSMAGSGWVLP